MDYEDGFVEAIKTAIEIVENLPKEQALIALRETLN